MGDTVTMITLKLVPAGGGVEMNAKFREFVKTGRGKLTVALGCLALSWIFLLWQFSGRSAT